MIAEMKRRLPVLWRHYSSWCIAAIGAVAGARELGLELAEYLPRWTLVVLTFAALASKIIPQKPLK